MVLGYLSNCVFKRSAHTDGVAAKTNSASDGWFYFLVSNTVVF